MLFITPDHEFFYDSCCARYSDSERLAACYILGLSSRLREHFADLVDSDGLFETDFSFPWLTGTDMRLYLLALNLYNGYVDEYPFNSTPKNLMADLSLIPYIFCAFEILLAD